MRKAILLLVVLELCSVRWINFITASIIQTALSPQLSTHVLVQSYDSCCLLQVCAGCLFVKSKVSFRNLNGRYRDSCFLISGMISYTCLIPLSDHVAAFNCQHVCIPTHRIKLSLSKSDLFKQRVMIMCLLIF